jgi:hypothetical protein
MEKNDEKSRTCIDEKGHLFNLDELAKKHDLGNMLKDANDNVIWLVRYLYQYR